MFRGEKLAHSLLYLLTDGGLYKHVGILVNVNNNTEMFSFLFLRGYTQSLKGSLPVVVLN